MLLDGPASGDDFGKDGVCDDGGGGGASVDARKGDGAIGDVAPSNGRLCVGGEMLRWREDGSGERDVGEVGECGDDEDSIPSGTVPLEAGPNPV